jgi:hypothetical protein
MGNMTEGQLKARRAWFLGNKIMKRNTHNNHGFWLHQRGYHLGDIRCIKCLKFIDPNDPKEAKEIGTYPSGRRFHMGCPAVGRGGAPFATCPRHSPSRKYRVENAKRY